MQRLAIGLAFGFLAAGCGSDGATDQSGSQGGSAGTAGEAGSAGTAGTGAGGDAGTSGTAGTGGDAGTGGTAGTGGEAGAGGTGGTGGAAAMTYTVGGTVAGLIGPLTLQNDGADDLDISADGSFTFTAEVTDGGAYDVTVFSEPGLQRCHVTTGTGAGTVSAAAVTDVEVKCEDQIVFQATDGVHGYELWKTDGTEAGTVMIKDCNPDAGDGIKPRSNVGPLLERFDDGTAFFAATDGQNGVELWLTDGTETGTFMFADLNPNGDSSPSGFKRFGDTFYFGANDGTHGSEPFKSDGTLLGTELIKDIRADGDKSSSPRFIGEVNGHIVFRAWGTDWNRLYVTDGTEEGTSPLSDVRVGGDAVVFDDRIFFQSFESADPLQLWETDGTSANTKLFLDPQPNGDENELGELAVVNGKLYFHAADDTHSVEPWVSDGTEVGTHMLKDMQAAGRNYAQGYAPCLGKTFFRASSDVYSTDGTEEGTVLASTVGSAPNGFTEVGGLCLYGASGGSGWDLRYTDGTPEGSGTLDINPGGSSQQGILGTVGGKLIFKGNDGDTGYEPYSSDGTLDGTRIIKNICPDTSGICGSFYID